MTPFATARTTIGWSIRHTSDLIGCDPRQVRRWEDGTYEAPAPLVEWLAAIAEFVADNPAPVRTPPQRS